jgi:hypothetical protein
MGDFIEFPFVEVSLSVDQMLVYYAMAGEE